MIDLKTFIKSTNEFDKREKRTNFFSLAQNLIASGFDTEGMLLVLSTWNFARFRFVVKEFDVDNFKRELENLRQMFDVLIGQYFQTVNFDKYKTNIQTIYNSLSKIKGVEFTGAPKLMQLKNPNVFVMWDRYIRGEKPKKHYGRLAAFKDGTFEYRKYPKDFSGYFQFLKDMQNRYKHLNLVGQKTLAKAVDEFNYVNITLPMQDIERRKRKTNAVKKRRTR
jgi:hypothetical protein